MEAINKNLHDMFYKEYHEKNFTKAIELLLSIQQMESDKSFWIYSRLSSCYYELKEYDKAVHYGELGYKLNSKSPLVIWDYAGALIMAKKEKKAIKLLLELQNMVNELAQHDLADPDNKWRQSLKVDANFLIGKAYYTICQDDFAREYLQKYIDQRQRGLKSIYSKKLVSSYLKKLEKISGLPH